MFLLGKMDVLRQVENCLALKSVHHLVRVSSTPVLMESEIDITIDITEEKGLVQKVAFQYLPGEGFIFLSNCGVQLTRPTI